MPIFGGKQIAELQQKLAIGEQQYQEARGEIARLSEELVRLSGELTAAQAGQANLQAFVDAHGGKAAWEAVDSLMPCDYLPAVTSAGLSANAFTSAFEVINTKRNSLPNCSNNARYSSLA